MSGDIRLWGGQSQHEGNIELCTDRRVWSTVSDSSWSNPEAVVACRQLGYDNFSKCKIIRHITTILITVANFQTEV